MTGDLYTRACEAVQTAARMAAAEREFVRWADPASDDYTSRVESFADSEVALWKALREMHAVRIEAEAEAEREQERKRAAEAAKADGFQDVEALEVEGDPELPAGHRDAPGATYEELRDPDPEP